MSYSLNRVELIGNLGADPDIRRSQSGDPIVNFRVATSDKWRDKNTGEMVDKTEWHSVVLFGNAAKIAEKYCRKGTRLYVAGKLKTEKWQDQQGNDRYTTKVEVGNYGGEIILLDAKGERDDDRAYDEGGDRSRVSAGKPAAGGGSLAEDLDDEIPFTHEWR